MEDYQQSSLQDDSKQTASEKCKRKFKMNIQDFFLGIWGLHMVVLPLGRLFCIKRRFLLKNTSGNILHCQKTKHDLEDLRYSP